MPDEREQAGSVREQGSHKNLKTAFHDFSMTDLLLSMTPHSHTVSDMIMIVSHNMHDNHELESCHSHENKQFHDFLGNFHISKTFPWQQYFPGFSMTVGTLREVTKRQQKQTSETLSRGWKFLAKLEIRILVTTGGTQVWSHNSGLGQSLYHL